MWHFPNAGNAPSTSRISPRLWYGERMASVLLHSSKIKVLDLLRSVGVGTPSVVVRARISNVIAEEGKP
jgi:hypothetical protein